MGLKEIFSSIAEAIREKSGRSVKFKPADMAQAILDIPTNEYIYVDHDPQRVDIELTENNKTYELVSDSGYDCIQDYSTVTVNVPIPEPDYETPDIVVYENGDIYAYANGKVGTYTLSDTDDSDLIPSNIKAGVDIFGVTGTYKSVTIPYSRIKVILIGRDSASVIYAGADSTSIGDCCTTDFYVSSYSSTTYETEIQVALGSPIYIEFNDPTWNAANGDDIIGSGGITYHAMGVHSGSKVWYLAQATSTSAGTITVMYG